MVGMTSFLEEQTERHARLDSPRFWELLIFAAAALVMAGLWVTT